MTNLDPLDPIVTLQHQRRGAVHAIKGDLALLRNSILLYERERSPEKLLEHLRILERDMTSTVRIYEPEFEKDLTRNSSSDKL